MTQKEQVSPYALTTLARVKDRLQITLDDSDAVLMRMINAATSFIERECGKSGLDRFPNDGHFIQKTYTNEVYSVIGKQAIYLPLRNAPVAYLIVSGNTIAGSNAVTNCSPVTGIVSGMPVLAQGVVPQGTTVAGITGTTITLSLPASVTQTGAVLEVSGLISFQYRAGTPSSPSWTTFIQDQFELEQQGYSGIVRVYGVMPRLASNMLRATYVAGYPVDWPNAGNSSTHLLPDDLANLCENLVVRIFKRRLLDGKSSENIAGATTSWRDRLDAFDQNVVDNYRRIII